MSWLTSQNMLRPRNRKSHQNFFSKFLHSLPAILINDDYWPLWYSIIKVQPPTIHKKKSTYTTSKRIWDLSVHQSNYWTDIISRVIWHKRTWLGDWKKESWPARVWRALFKNVRFMLDEMTQKFVKFYGIVLKYSTSTAQKPKVDFSTFHFGIVYFTLSLIGVSINIYIHSLAKKVKYLAQNISWVLFFQVISSWYE